MLNQAASDRDKLSHLLKIPENMMSFVTGAPAGSGLIYCGLNGSLPFKDDFPTDTRLLLKPPRQPLKLRRKRHRRQAKQSPGRYLR